MTLKPVLNRQNHPRTEQKVYTCQAYLFTFLHWTMKMENQKEKYLHQVFVFSLIMFWIEHTQFSYESGKKNVSCWCNTLEIMFSDFANCSPQTVICQIVPSVLWYCWLGLLNCKTVSHITYTVLVETLNPAQSINKSINCAARWAKSRQTMTTTT